MGVKIDLNCDMGESFGMYKMGLDEEVIEYISSASIACGFHAGDPGWMRHTVELAETHGVAIGAHPSYPDLVGFGRRNMSVTPDEARGGHRLPGWGAAGVHEVEAAPARQAPRGDVQTRRWTTRSWLGRSASRCARWTRR